MIEETSHPSGTRLERVPLVFLDIESTGLSPGAGDRMCELALVRIRGAVVQAQYAVLINPQRPMGAQALSVHGISPEMLADAPVFAEIVPALLPLLSGATLVAHNAPFDIAFLASELERLGLPPPVNPVLDTLVLSRRLLRRASHSLMALSTDLGLPHPTHRAMNDVLALEGVFAHLRSQLAALGIITLEDTLRYQRGLLPGQPDPAPPPIIEQALRLGCRLHIVYRSLSSPDPTDRVVRPIDLTYERSGVYLRAYCFLRNDLRSFALEKIDFMELVELDD